MVVDNDYPSRAVFLDRDGVINRPHFFNGRSYAPTNFHDFVLYEGVRAAVERIKRLDFKIIIVTNQPDVGHGRMHLSELNKMHQALKKEIPVDDIFVCKHRQDENCTCRKPKPGLLLMASAQHSLDFEKSFLIGDRTSDMLAAKAVGCKSIFIDLNYEAETKPESVDYSCENLQQAAAYIEKLEKAF